MLAPKDNLEEISTLHEAHVGKGPYLCQNFIEYIQKLIRKSMHHPKQVQCTKYQGPSANKFRDILLTSSKCSKDYVY